MKKTTSTPKSIVSKKFGSRARYKVEEVQEIPENKCPGLIIAPNGPILYRCTLELPELVVVSDTFRKKKDAEQSAAEMALKKLGIFCADDNIPEKEPWDCLIERFTYLFSNELHSSSHPFGGHIRAALQRNNDLCGSIPASVIGLCDTKMSSICKALNYKVESSPVFVLPLILSAAAKLADLVVISKDRLSVRKLKLNQCELTEISSIQKSGFVENEHIEAVHVPCELDKPIQPIILDVSSDEYYLDAIAKGLGVTDGNRIIFSRVLGKATSETRFYFAVPESLTLDLSSDPEGVEVGLMGCLNARACNISGQDIYGDAIMATIGYAWRSKGLVYEALSAQSYYRMLLSKLPSGYYKLSRGAILAAELPTTWTTKAYWRGSFPKEILCAFCHQHHLSEPAISAIAVPFQAPVELPKSHGTEHPDESSMTADNELEVSQSSYRCEVKIFSCSSDLLIECSPKEIYRKQNDCIHSASLRVLSWLNSYFEGFGNPLEKLYSSAAAHGVQFHADYFKKLLSCQSACTLPPRFTGRRFSLKIEGLDSGTYPSGSSLLCVCYSVSLMGESTHEREFLERDDEFEFEVGTGAVIDCLETSVRQLSVGQSAIFNVELMPLELVFAAATDFSRVSSLLSSEPCTLEYTVTLLKVTNPPEERMELAIFSPSLSRQRVDYALRHIEKACATSLVDFGCGSGSLLESLLDYPTSLQKIVGVDISRKALSHAAKIIHSKLSKNSASNITSAILYDGSITSFDHRLSGFDIGTCLEVIEHMEEEEALVFGNVALSCFRPKILLVSTPNYEYNVILKGAANPGEVEVDGNPRSRSDAEPRQFRVSGHKFEWTRRQFHLWASDLAQRHGYAVEFSGVGGSADVEPGFASQIAVFKSQQSDHLLLSLANLPELYNVVWAWNPGPQLPHLSS